MIAMLSLRYLLHETKQLKLGRCQRVVIADVSCHSDVLRFLVPDWEEVKIRREMCNELTCVLQRKLGR